jgi:hypothetical protein
MVHGIGNNKMSSTLGAALYYAKEKQWPVVPVWTIRDGKCSCGNPDCTRIGKHPITKFNGQEVVPRGVLDATTDPKTIKKWWRLVGNDPNIGIRAERFFALDIDDEEAYFELVSVHGRLPDTIESLSGSGGRHILFNQPKGKILGNEQGDLPRGIDVRGRNGYIIVPPSIHKSGDRYEWEASSHPKDIKMVDAPEWLVQLISASNNDLVTQVEFSDAAAPELASIDISKTTKARILNAPAEGEDRSSLDMQVACALADSGCSASQIRAIFMKYPIGKEGKYAERGDTYLERTVSKAMSWAKPRKKVASRIVPGKEVTPEEARIEQAALSIAYKQGWNDALASNMKVVPQMWPQYLGITEASVAHYGIGMRTDYKIDKTDREFPALIIPYRTGGKVTTLDLTLYGQPEKTPGRLWETIDNKYVFDTDLSRDSDISGRVLITEDWDTAMFTYLIHSINLNRIDVLAQPAARSGKHGKLARLRALAGLLGNAEQVILAWPRNRKSEAVILAKLLEQGAERVLWISTPASLRDMYMKYELNATHLKRYISSASPIIQ